MIATKFYWEIVMQDADLNYNSLAELINFNRQLLWYWARLHKKPRLETAQSFKEKMNKLFQENLTVEEWFALVD